MSISLGFCEAGSDSTQGLEFYSFTTGTVASSTTQAKTGPRSISINNGGITAPAFLGTAGIVFVSAYFYFPGDPASASPTLGWANSSSGIGSGVMVRRRTDGKLEFHNGVGTIVVGTNAVQNNQWVHLAVAVNYVSSGTDANNQIAWWIDGVQDASTTNFSFNALSISYACYRHGAASTAYIDNMAAGTDTAVAFPGDICVTHKAPAADNTSGFDTGIGSGTNRYDRVSERPLSVTNGWQHAANSDAQENYTLQTASQGDVDITGAQILGYTGWMYAKRGDPDAWNTANYASIGTVNNKTTNHSTTVITLTSSVSAGQSVLVACALDDDGNPGTTATCADSQGNTYTDVGQYSGTGSGTGSRIAFFVANNIGTALSSGTDTITITGGSGVDASAAAAWKFTVSNGLASSGLALGSNGYADTGTGTWLGPSTSAISTMNAIYLAGLAVEAPSDDQTWSVNGSATGGSATVVGAELLDGTTGGGAASNQTIKAEHGYVQGTDAVTTFSASASGNGSGRDGTVAIAIVKAADGIASVGSPKLTLNGTEYSKTLTTSSALYTQIVTSASYPSNAAGIGMRSSGTTADSYLYECGALIAYIPSTFSHLPIFGSRRPIGIRV